MEIRKIIMTDIHIDHLAYMALFTYLEKTYGYLGQPLPEKQLGQLSGVNADLLAFNQLRKYNIDTSNNVDRMAACIKKYLTDFIDGRIV